MSVQRLTVEEALTLVADTLVRCRTSRANATSVARALIGAELADQPGHGLRRLLAYGAQALSGKVDGLAIPALSRPRPGTLLIDAGHGFAYPALDLAIRHLPDAARQQGIALAGLWRSHHCGVAGLAVEALANEGMVALLFANTPAAMAPWGGRRALFGTNPVAAAFPLPDAEPVVIDISLSRVARGKVMAAAQKGEPIPEGWALDADGNPTTDAGQALAGTMLAMGEAKGAALALMVELLAAGLTGARFAYEASSFLDADGDPPGTGQLLIAIDPGAFGPGTTAHLGELASQVEATDGARLPGRRRQAHRQRIRNEGIPVEAGLLARIDALGR